MKTLLDSVAARRVVTVLSGLVIVALALAVGRFVPTQPMVALGAAVAVLALGLTVADPAVIPLLAMPLLLIVQRIGPGGLQLSVSDAALIAATLTALVFTPRPFTPALRNLLWLSAVYQFATLFTVVVNPHQSNTVEWFHAWMLVSGALIVGWTIGRSGHARLGLSLIVVVALGLAGCTIVSGVLRFLEGNFSPVYVEWPFAMHKNFVGTVLGLVAVIVYVRPSWTRWRAGPAIAAFWVLSLGLLFTQSRQAIIGLGVALVVVALRGRERQRRSKAILLFVVPALVFVGTLVKDQQESGSGFNSFYARLTWFQQSLEYWGTSPWLGHGLRFWYRPGELPFQPPNAELEMLASAGVVGLVAFLLLMFGTLVILWRVDPAYGTLAVAVFVSRFLQGQFDLFWVAVQTSLPFVVAGICLGVQAWDQEAERLSGSTIRRPEAVR